MEYVCIDFETANASYYSACAIGVVHFKDEKIVYSKSFLIKPHVLYSKFHWYNTKIHGLTSKKVANSPEFNKVWEEIKHLFDDKIIVAHNATFDISVLLNILELYNIEKPKFTYICTVEISKKIWHKLPKHKLDAMASHLKIQLNHHEAESDARASGFILMEAMKQKECTDIETMLKEIGLKSTNF